MIEINEVFSVAAPPGEVYAVLSDPNAVVDCVAGAKLGQQNEDGSFDGAMTVKFSALRVSFSGRVALTLDPDARQGTVSARGRDGQGGTKFQATAAFQVEPADDGSASQVTASGEVELSGKLASVIEGAAGAVVKRMTLEFVDALSLRCASGPAELAPAQGSAPAGAAAPAAPTEPVAAEAAAADIVAPGEAGPGDAGPGDAGAMVSASSAASAGASSAVANGQLGASQPGAPGRGPAGLDARGPARPGAEPAQSAPGVLLLHGFGGSPGGLRAWSEALAAAGAAVSVPRLPGHGTRWRDLDRTSEADWLAAAADSLVKLQQAHQQIWVMGISLGATLALRLAEERPADVVGVVAVNPVLTGLQRMPRMLGLARLIRRSSPAVSNDVKKPGVKDIGYGRVPFRALRSLIRLGSATTRDLSRIQAPVLLGISGADHVVAPADAELAWNGLPTSRRQRIGFADSYHLVPVDNDSSALFAASTAFMRSQALAEASS
jgi:esterase/lipase/carbon monoxide dehydrogenase subunit G